MPLLITFGIITAGIGLIGLIYCIIQAAKLRKNTDADATSAALQRLIPINYAALAVATLGLCLVIIGMVLS